MWAKEGELTAGSLEAVIDIGIQRYVGCWHPVGATLNFLPACGSRFSGWTHSASTLGLAPHVSRYFIVHVALISSFRDPLRSFSGSFWNQYGSKLVPELSERGGPNFRDTPFTYLWSTFWLFRSLRGPRCPCLYRLGGFSALLAVPLGPFFGCFGRGPGSVFLCVLVTFCV